MPLGPPLDGMAYLKQVIKVLIVILRYIFFLAKALFTNICLWILFTQNIFYMDPPPLTKNCYNI